MCYFLQLTIHPQGRQPVAEGLVRSAAERSGVVLQGEFPALLATDGHCSCDFVREGHAITLGSFVQDVVQAEGIKWVLVG